MQYINDNYKLGKNCVIGLDVEMIILESNINLLITVSLFPTKGGNSEAVVHSTTGNISYHLIYHSILQTLALFGASKANTSKSTLLQQPLREKPPKIAISGWPFLST